LIIPKSTSVKRLGQTIKDFESTTNKSLEEQYRALLAVSLQANQCLQDPSVAYKRKEKINNLLSQVKQQQIRIEKAAGKTPTELIYGEQNVTLLNKLYSPPTRADALSANVQPVRQERSVQSNTKDDEIAAPSFGRNNS